MEKLEVTMDISEASLETLTEAILEDLQDKVQSAIDDCDFSDKIESAIEDYDFDDKVQNWFDYNLDIESEVKDQIENMDLSQNLDIENEARNLLESYSPINQCGTGMAFTNAIEEAVRYLLLKDNDFVVHIAKALEKLEKKKLMEEVRDSVREELKPLMFDHFKAELERYAAHVEYEKAQQIITQTNAVVIPEVTPWTRENDIGY